MHWRERIIVFHVTSCEGSIGRLVIASSMLLRKSGRILDLLSQTFDWRNPWGWDRWFRDSGWPWNVSISVAMWENWRGKNCLGCVLDAGGGLGSCSILLKLGFVTKSHLCESWSDEDVGHYLVSIMRHRDTRIQKIKYSLSLNENEMDILYKTPEIAVYCAMQIILFPVIMPI